MPVIPSLQGFNDGQAANIQQVYLGPVSGGVYDPGNLDTLEAMNGGLDADNYGGGDGTIPARAVQRGTWARAVYLPWSQFAYYYAKQATGEDSEPVIARLAVEFFLPWAASVVWIGWQGLFEQDATAYGTGVTPAEERWELATFFDGAEMEGLSAGLPVTRATTDTATTNPIANDAQYSLEERWRYVSRKAIEMDVSAGAHRVEVRLRPTILKNDYYTEKVAQACGSIYIIAFR